MPTKTDKTTGQTAAICGIMGVSVLVVFGIAYAFGSVEKKRREAALEDLSDLEQDAIEAQAELREERIEESDPPPKGSAACPICGSVYLDKDHAAQCCEESRRETLEEEGSIIVDRETGEVRDNEEEEEPDDVEDLWGDHIQSDD
jgi:hypothetical protein